MLQHSVGRSFAGDVKVVPLDTTSTAMSMSISTVADAATLPPGGLETLFDEQSRRLVGALTTYTGNHGDAEELAQEAFARLCCKQSQLRDPDRAVSYLYSAAFNLARSRWRRQRAYARVLVRLGDNADVSPDVAAISSRNATEAATTCAVRALPERQRACVVLHYYTELSVFDTAAALGISANSVKTHLQRAFVSLRIALDGEEGREGPGGRVRPG